MLLLAEPNPVLVPVVGDEFKLIQNTKVDVGKRQLPRKELDTVIKEGKM